MMPFVSSETVLLLVSSKNQDCEKFYFLSMRRVIILYSQPVKFVRRDSEHVQNDGKSVNHGHLVSDLPRGCDS